MESNEENAKKKKLNDDVVTFMRKRSDHDAPRYTARLKTYVQVQAKRSRANNARHRDAAKHAAASARKDKRELLDRNENANDPKLPLAGDKALEPPPGDQPASEDRMSRKSRRGQEDRDSAHSGHSMSRSLSGDPSDRCGRRRRRKRCRRRRRSCKRRRRRRRSCCRRRRRRRRSCKRRRRRRRSCRRRRRRRSCCKRRRRRRSCRRRRRRRC